MRVLLLGSTDLTLRVADSILALGIEIAAICHVQKEFNISYAPRGVLNSRHADVEGWCRQHGVPAYCYQDEHSLRGAMSAWRADFGLACGWYHRVSRLTRGLLPLGCAGIHASLLPDLRGGAPLNWAILRGLAKTGVSLFELGDGIDDAPLYGQRSFPIGPRSAVGDLVRLSIDAACALITDVLPAIRDGRATLVSQQGDISYGLQRAPEDGHIDWRQSAEAIDRLVRAVSEPYPGARTWLDGQTIMIWESDFPGNMPPVFGTPGQIFKISPQDVVVATGQGCLMVRRASLDDGTDALPLLFRSGQRRFQNIPASDGISH